MIKAKDRKHKPEPIISEAEIDENIIETFPASDPPSWTLGIDPHKGREKKVSPCRRLKNLNLRRGR